MRQPQPQKQNLAKHSSPIRIELQSFTPDPDLHPNFIIIRSTLHTPSNRSLAAIISSTKFLRVRKVSAFTVPDIIPGTGRVPITIAQAVAENEAEDFGGPV